MDGSGKIELNAGLKPGSVHQGNLVLTRRGRCGRTATNRQDRETDASCLEDVFPIWVRLRKARCRAAQHRCCIATRAADRVKRVDGPVFHGQHSHIVVVVVRTIHIRALGEIVVKQILVDHEKLGTGPVTVTCGLIQRELENPVHLVAVCIQMRRDPRG